MSVTISIRAIELTPGSTISIHNLSWQEFEQVLTELGEQRLQVGLIHVDLVLHAEQAHDRSGVLEQRAKLDDRRLVRWQRGDAVILRCG